MRARCKTFMQHMNYLEIFKLKAILTPIVFITGGHWNIAIGDGAAEVCQGVRVCNGTRGARNLPTWTRDVGRCSATMTIAPAKRMVRA